MKKWISRICAIAFILSFFCGNYDITAHVKALEENDDMQEFVVSDTVGEYGCYEIDETTGERVLKMYPEYADYEPVPVVDYCYDDFNESDSEISPYATDDRWKVTSPQGIRTSTCLIGSRFGSKVSSATGWLINDTYLVTAAHAIYSWDYGEADHVAVYIGASGGNQLQYRLGHAYAWGGEYNPNVSSEDEFKYWHRTEGRHDDWAIVKLDSPVTVSVQYLNLAPTNSANEMSGTYQTQGYPGDLNPGVVWSKKYMYAGSGVIEGNRTRSLPNVYSSIKAAAGQSGAPVYKYSNPRFYVYAILITDGKTDTGASHSNSTLILVNDWLANYIYDNCY